MVFQVVFGPSARMPLTRLSNPEDYAAQLYRLEERREKQPSLTIELSFMSTPASWTGILLFLFALFMLAMVTRKRVGQQPMAASGWFAFALGLGAVAAKASIPLWVMMVGAIGIALGLALYGPKLIRTVGSEITELDQSRAFCIAMAAAITVIIATQFGLPVSSTHIAVGAVFGVGFLREYLKSSHHQRLHEIRSHHHGVDEKVVESYLTRFEQASVFDKGNMLRQLKAQNNHSGLSKSERKNLKRIYRTELVKRAALLKIVAAWLITVPVSGLFAAIFFFTIRGMML